MTKTNKINIPIFELNIPEEYQPEWYKLGIDVHKIDPRLEGDGVLKMPTTINKRRGFAPINQSIDMNTKKINIKEPEHIKINIKEPEQMEHSIESMWFEADDQPSDYTKMIDDNEKVNYEAIQKIKVADEAFSSIEKIREKILNKTKIKKEKVKIGEFVVMLKGKNIFISDKISEIKSICEKIIIENENINDDDLMVFYRVSLGKFFEKS